MNGCLLITCPPNYVCIYSQLTISLDNALRTSSSEQVGGQIFPPNLELRLMKIFSYDTHSNYMDMVGERGIYAMFAR